MAMEELEGVLQALNADEEGDEEMAALMVRRLPLVEPTCCRVVLVTGC